MLPKILSNHSQFYDNEKEILEFLKDKNIPNIINLVNSGDGDIVEGNTFHKKQYLILEYAEKGDLSKYINIPGRPLKENHAKYFFTKILKAVQALHKNGICHRDLKTGNILLDNKFNPKICDFGFSTYIQKNLKDILGTPEYAAPEIYKGNYDGEKVDIFALGVILFNLVTGIYPFNEAKITDKVYRLIMLKKYKLFWEQLTQVKGVSEDFKKLYVKMIAFKPVERPSIEKILDNDWIKGKENNNEDLKIKNEKKDNINKDIETEIYEDFIERENIINNSTKKEIEIVSDDDSDNECYGISEDFRSISNEEINYFDDNVHPQIFREGKNLEYFIKIKGRIKPAKFMNKLINKIEEEKDKNGYHCKIEVNKKNNKLKFKAHFDKIEEEDNEEEIDENLKEELAKLNLDEEENIENEDSGDIITKSCCIKIDLFEFDYEEYILRFVRESGEKDDFYKILKIIYSYVGK